MRLKKMGQKDSNWNKTERGNSSSKLSPAAFLTRNVTHNAVTKRSPYFIRRKKKKKKNKEQRNIGMKLLYRRKKIFQVKSK